MTDELRLQRALRSLDGLSVGDAFGEMSPWPGTSDDLAPGPWAWTDDTHMALSIVEVLAAQGGIDPDALARAFARRFSKQPHRGYGGGAFRLLAEIASGGDWRTLSPRLFGQGSYGNGGAMRAAPIGGFFHDDPSRAAREAQLSAAVTHAHPEGQAGAMAVAVAASIASHRPHPSGREYLDAVLPHVPAGLTKVGIERARDIPAENLVEAVARLGTGMKISAQDTVPFCLWCAAHHLDDYEAALWKTASGQGDCDTTCAIVGGIVALSAPEIPAEWLARREPLDLSHATGS